MSDVTITVTGPGGCISYEMEVIRRALVAAGVNVQVVDSHPIDCDVQEYMDEALARMRPDGEFAKKLGKPVVREVKLVAQHCPWGG